MASDPFFLCLPASYFMTYAEQIKHPKWQKKRLEILERDEYYCQCCGGDEDTLHVHHYYYVKGKMIWEYDNEVLITLCDDCHSDWHTIKKQIDKILTFPTDYLREILDLLEAVNKSNPHTISLTTQLILHAKKM